VTAQRTVDAVEAAYRLDGDHDAWLAGLLEAVHRDLDLGAGLYAFSARVGAAGFAPDSPFTSRQLDPGFLALLAELNRDPPKELLDELAKSLVRVGGLEQILGAAHPVTRHFRATARNSGFTDGFTLFAQDGEGAGLCLSAPARAVDPFRPATLGIWRRAGLHFAAALRLRRKLAAGAARCEALVTPGGALADADGPFKDDAGLRGRLRTAVQRVEQARSRSVRRDPHRALELWQGLVEGRWSLVDRWESDGRRYVAVHANAPERRDFRSLTGPERTALHYVVLGASNKEIAFALGVPMGTAATWVRGATRKLGGRNRRDLIGIDQAEALQLELQGDALGVLRSLSATDSNLVARLTPGERAVVDLLVQGATNAQIAKARGRSVKTVANQLSSIFTKLGVESRTGAVVKVLDDAAATARARR